MLAAAIRTYQLTRSNFSDVHISLAMMSDLQAAGRRSLNLLTPEQCWIDDWAMIALMG